jgi:hypothetical protein
VETEKELASTQRHIDRLAEAAQELQLLRAELGAAPAVDRLDLALSVGWLVKLSRFQQPRVGVAHHDRALEIAKQIDTGHWPRPGCRHVAETDHPVRPDSLQVLKYRAEGDLVSGIFITGERDPARAGVEAAHRLLASAGLEVRLEVVPGLGHEYPVDTAPLLEAAMRFVLA